VEARCSTDAIHSVPDASTVTFGGAVSCVATGGGRSAVVNVAKETTLLLLPLVLEASVVSGLHSSDVTAVVSAAHKPRGPLSCAGLTGAVGALVGENAPGWTTS
jgi:hypothetical protein